jgi:hypothetical protein
MYLIFLRFDLWGSNEIKFNRGEKQIMQIKTKELLKLTKMKKMKAVIHKQSQSANTSRFVD